MDQRKTTQRPGPEIKAVNNEPALCKERLARQQNPAEFSLFSDSIRIDPAAFMNPDYVYLNVNRAYGELWGRPKDEIVGISVGELLGDDTFHRVRDKLEQCLAGETVVFKGWFESAARGRCYLHVTYQPFRDGNGKVAGLVDISKDVTGYGQALEKLKESKEGLNVLFGQAADAMFVADMEGTLIRVNEQACRSTGFGREDLLGMNLADLDAKIQGDRDGLKKFYGLMSEEGPVTFNSRHRKKDGSTYPVELTASKLLLRGEPVILGIARDLRKRQAGEVEYGQVLKSAADGFWVLDRSGRILEANRAVGKMHGYDHKQMPGMTVEQVAGDETASAWRRHLARAGETGRDVFDARHRRKDGGWLDLEVSTSFLPVNGGRFASFIRDAGECKHLEREHEIALNLIRRLSSPSDLKSLLADMTRLMREWSGCEAVGIRLRDGEDYPYFETRGFPEEFVRLESRLCRTGSGGDVLRDEAGNPVLDCMCGNVIQGRADPSLPFFTKNGSFWTNSTSELLASTSEKDRQARTRNRCNGEGYESVALIPLRYGDETLGLLQFNDHLRDRFNPETITLFERLAANLAIGLVQRRSTEQLLKHQEKYRSLYRSMAEMFVLHKVIYREGAAVDYRILDCNPAFCRITGIERERAVGALASEIYAAGAPPFLDIYARTAETGEPAYFESFFPPMKKHFSISVFSSEKGEFGTVSLDITAQKQKEEALRISEERLELALDSVRDAVWDRRLDTEETYFSPRWYTMLGYRPSEFPPGFETWRSLVHPDDLPETERRLGIDLKSGEPFEVEFRMRAKDGGWRWILNRGRVIERDEGGNPLRMLGTHVDITDRKLAEAAVLKSEAKMRSIFRASPIGIGVVVDRVLVEVNDRFCSMVGYDRDELLGQSARMLYPTQEDYDTVGKVKYTQIAERGTGSVETRMMRKNSEIFDVLLSSTPLDISDLGAGVTFTALDITTRKKAETDLKISRQTLLTVLDGIDATIYVSDMQTHEVLFMNRRMVEDFGSNCTGKLCHEVFRNRSEPCKDCTNHLLLDKSGRPAGVQVWEEKSPVTGNWCMNHDRAILWNNGKMVRLEIAIDITELKESQSEKARLETQLALAQKMDALGTLAGGIAHDFNNILATIMGYSELIQDDLEPDDPIRADLGEIVKASGRGKDLVRQILTFSRKTEVNQKVVSLNRAVEEASAILERVIPKMIRLELDLDRNLKPVRANSQQLEQIVFNLVSNAADAIEVDGKIRITTRNLFLENKICHACGSLFSGEYVMFSIKDNGIGMTPETKANMLDPFFTTKGIGKGTGLGLSTVYGILTSHQGHLACRSQEGKGTEFVIYLPVANEPAAPELEPSPAVSGGGGLRGTETLLVVDDEPAMRKVAGNILSRNGYKVFKAESGEMALEIIAQSTEPIHGVVLDLGMPGMGGKKCLPKILELNPGAKVLVASGYIQYEAGDELERLGAAGMVAKPYTKSELLDRVRRMLDDSP